MELLVYWAVVVASALGLITWQHVRNPLRDVPGPFLARWTDWWYMWHLFRGDFERVNQDLHKKHGEQTQCPFPFGAIPWGQVPIHVGSQRAN